MRRALLLERATEGAAGRGRPAPRLESPRPIVQNRIQFEPFGPWYELDWTHAFGCPIPIFRGPTEAAYRRYRLGH